MKVQRIGCRPAASRTPELHSFDSQHDRQCGKTVLDTLRSKGLSERLGVLRRNAVHGRALQGVGHGDYRRCIASNHIAEMFELGLQRIDDFDSQRFSAKGVSQPGAGPSGAYRQVRSVGTASEPCVPAMK